MKTADILNAAGIVVTGLGSSLGMLGIFRQTNAYYAFRPTQFLEHLFRVGRRYLSKGKEAAIAEVYATVKLGEEKKEDRTRSLIGLYFVFVGFVVQLVGSIMLLAALLSGSA